MPAQLIALATSICYACALVSARIGLQYSTPVTVTCVSVIIQTVTLWAAIVLIRGLPEVPALPVFLFILVGITQLGVRLFAYSGVHKIGPSRSSALQSVSPLVSAVIGILILNERVTAEIVAGTFLVVLGILLVSRRPEKQVPTFRWGHLLLPIAAALLTGINHPIRRYALSLSNEPLFFAAVMGGASLAGFLFYVPLSRVSERFVWNRKAIVIFSLTGLAETFSILLIITALSIGPVVVVAPIAATYPVWALLGSVIFLRDVERINALAILGTLSVVAGVTAIHLGSLWS